MAWTANDIKNLMLMELNHDTIRDWNDKTNTDLPIINTQYALAKKVALSKYPWSFSIKHVIIEFEETENAPHHKYKYIAQLPDDALCNFALYIDEAESILADYYIVGNTICANRDKLYMQYTYNAPETEFTAEFVDWFKVFGASRMNGYINGDMQRQQLLDANEPQLYRTAKNIDSKRNKHESLDDNPMLTVRHKWGF